MRGEERRLETKQNVRIDRPMNPWGLGWGVAVERWGKKDITKDVWGGGGKLTSVRKARRLREQAGKPCGKCDHSFNLKLSGVNQECVAGRDGGED